ncbi:hypothetical protein DFH06DRAFT_46198 [Mycena polygramma]|nr:hypothetical protein DFH06DRAFT_46198 [Mycena polygramma]
MLRCFEVAADQLVSVIEDERADASDVSRQQLATVESQFNAFRNAAFTTHAANEAINDQCRQEIHTLRKKVQELQELQYILHHSGIYNSHGRLAFGPQWGALVRGFRPNSPNLPQGPLLSPKEVTAALDAQWRAEIWRRNRDSVEIARLENLVRWYRDLHETNYQPIPMGLPTPLVEVRSLKREVEHEPRSRDPEPAAKRSRLEESPVEYRWDTAPTFYSQLPTSPSDCVSGGLFQPTVCEDNPPLYAPLTALPIIDRWNCTLSECVQTESSRQCVLPPLVAFLDAHSCTYHLWFATRASLFGRVGDPRSSHTVSTAEQWQVKLYNEKGKTDYAYNEKVFDTSGVRCACGMPPLLPSIVRKLPQRADGTPIQSNDFESHALQAIICADLELAHAKLQFEQTDDILLNLSSCSAQQWAERTDARENIFRNSWDPSFAAVPLEASDLLTRRPWIIRFRELLQDWPNFDMAGSFPAAEDEANPAYLDSLASYEQRMIAFYLETVSSTLGICPARPRERPAIDALPELYRNILS